MSFHALQHQVASTKGQKRTCWGFLLTPLLRNLNRNRAHLDWLP